MTHSHQKHLALEHYKRFNSTPRKAVNFNDVKISEVVLRSVFSLPPEKAIEYLKNKGYEISWSWKDVLADAQRRSFTVAKVMSADVLQLFHDELQSSLKEGLTLDDFRERMTKKLASQGWVANTKEETSPSGEKVLVKMTPARLKTIYETNLQSSYMDGRWQGMQAVADTRPFMRYVNADPKAPVCRNLIEKNAIFRIGDPGVRIPPLHYRCKTRIVSMSAREVERRGGNIAEADTTFKRAPVQESFDSPPNRSYRPSTEGYTGAIKRQLSAALKQK